MIRKEWLLGKSNLIVYNRSNWFKIAICCLWDSLPVDLSSPCWERIFRLVSWFKLRPIIPHTVNNQRTIAMSYILMIWIQTETTVHTFSVHLDFMQSSFGLSPKEEPCLECLIKLAIECHRGWVSLLVLHALFCTNSYARVGFSSL